MNRLALTASILAVAAWAALALVLTGATSDAESARTVALFALALGLPFLCCWRRWDETPSEGVDLFQPGSVMATLVVFYAVIPAAHVWLDKDYFSDWTPGFWPPARLFQFTLLLWVLGLVAFGIGYRLKHPGRLPPSSPAEKDSVVRWPHAATVAAVAMLALGLPFRLYHLVALGGFTTDVFLFLSPDYTAEARINVGGIVTFFETFFDWGALLLIFRAIVTNRHKLLTSIVAVVAFLLAYVLSGKRTAVFPFLLFPVTWIHYLKRRVGVVRGLGYLSVGVAVVTLLLFLRMLGPLLAAGVSPSSLPNETTLEPVRFYLNSPELATFDMTMLAVGDRTPLLHQIGGTLRGALQYNLAPVAYFVPRVLWPGKQSFTDLGQVFFQYAFGGREEVGFAVGIVGGLYLFGGTLGVLLGMATVGYLFRLAYEWLRPSNREPVRVFLYAVLLWMAFLLLRFGTLGSTLAYFIQFELPGLIVALLVLRSPPPPHSRSLRET